MKKGPRRALRAHMGKKKGAPRDIPAAPPRPTPLDAGRAPSTGQRRPALPRADPAVPSALGGLASGFGMGPGVPRPPWPLTGGRRSSMTMRLPPTLEGFPRALGAAQRARRTAYPGLDLLELHPPSTCAAPAGMRRVRARAISAARLRLSPALHLRPINQVVYLGPYRKEN